MTGKTKSSEMAARKTPEASSPSRTLAPSVSSSGFGFASLMAAAGNMSIQSAAREEGAERAPVRPESAWNFLSVPQYDRHPHPQERARQEAAERYDRAPAGERSREALRAALLGLDRDRHAELEDERVVRRPLPYLGEMERAFGRQLGDVKAYIGMFAELAPLGANALFAGNTVAFADAQPSPALVAHEVTHLIQNQNAVSAAPMAAGVVAPRDSPAEAEADGVSSLVAAHGLGTPLPAITAAPAAHIQLNAGPGTPVVRVDRTADAEELRAAIGAGDKKKILEILERNANPEHMYALCQAVTAGVANRLEYILDGTDWARARVFLGEMVPLHRQIATHDKDAIFRDLQQLPDQRVLDLFNGVPSGPFRFTVSLGPTVEIHEPPTHAPEPTTLAEVQTALRDKLSPDDFYKAMRLLLEKAGRAMAAHQAQGRTATGPPDLAGLVIVVDDLTVQPGDPDGGLLPIVLFSGFDPVSESRIRLAEERVRAVDAAGPTGESEAFLAITDLSAEERKALALRLKDPPLKQDALGDELCQLATEADDAALIQRAIERAYQIAQMRRQVLKGPGLDAAIQRAGTLVRQARARLEHLPETAPEEDRKKAQEEVTRLEQMFFGDTHEGSWVRSALENETTNDPDRDPGLYAQKLHAMGADPVTIGREMLKRTRVWEFDQFIATLKAIKPEHRAPALKASGRLWDVHNVPMSDDHRELILAYVEQGMPRVSDLGPLPPQDPGVPQIGVITFMGGMSPEATIALHDVLGWMDRGPSTAYLVLSRLDGLTLADRTALLEEPRFASKLQSLPEGDEKSEERDFRDTLRTVAKNKKTAAAIVNYPGPGNEGGPWYSVKLEELRAASDRAGHANMRRAYVLKKRIARDPSIADQLIRSDTDAIAALDKYDAEMKDLNSAFKSQADEIVFGQPQIVDTAEAAVDPNMEASYMFIRLREKAEVPDDKSLSETGERPGIAEALAQFDTLYAQVRPGGVSKGDLARLAEAYHRATRAIDEDKVLKAENEGLAKLAATVAGVVVAVVVTAATGGVLGPVAVAVLAGISAGAAAAVAGAAVRWEDTAGSVLTDFGTGAVEGVATVAGAGLASKLVRGTSAGLSAGRAAAEAGGRAAARSGSSLAAKVAEGAIDGAVGNVAGELFQTAVDEATWDRGAAEGFAKMLAAIARGAVTGAAAGGAVGGIVGGLGKLAARAGDDVALGIGHMLDESGVGSRIIDNIADKPHEMDDLARAYHLFENGNVREAENLIHRLDGLQPSERELLITFARVRGQMRATGALDGVEVDGTVVQPRILVEKEFRKVAKDEHADAIFIIENGKPSIVVRRGAPTSAIREELTHLQQWQTDITMRQRMERLSEEKLADWDKLSPQDQLSRHVDKLEVEADAQRRIIAQLENDIGDDPVAAMALRDAEETLFHLTKRLDDLRPFRGTTNRADIKKLKKLGIAEKPRMFGKGASTPPKVEGPRADMSRANVGKQIDDPNVQRELRALGYRFHKEDGTGPIFKITRESAQRGNLPHLRIELDADGNRIIKEGAGRQSFAEQKAAAAKEWTFSQEALKDLRGQLDTHQLTEAKAILAHQTLKKKGWHFRVEVEARIKTGELDEGGAMLVAKWGQCILELESKSAVGSGERYTINFFLQQLPKPPITPGKVKEFRQLVRKSTLDYVESLPLPSDRTKALNDMLDLQPDSASKGELFDSFFDRFSKADNKFFTNPKVSPKTFRGKDLANPRTPDNVLDARDVDGNLPPGRYAIEKKAGKGAFKLEQAIDYAKRSDPNVPRRPGAHTKPGETGGFKQTLDATTSEYDGFVFVFSRKTEAEDALAEMVKEGTIAPILGKHPGGIHIMYFSIEGELIRWPL